jgi:hypothetical protein
MSFILPALWALWAVAVVYLLVKASGKPVFVVIVGVFFCLGLVLLLIIPGGAMIGQNRHPIGAINNRAVPDAVANEDHKFLNDLIQQENQAKAEIDSKPAPRAELVVNTSEVRRAQLVVNNRVVERAAMVQPGR